VRTGKGINVSGVKTEGRLVFPDGTVGLCVDQYSWVHDYFFFSLAPTATLLFRY